MGLPGAAWFVRLLGLFEMAVGAGAVIVEARWLAGAVSLSYAAFASFVAVALVRKLPLSSCGCFGRPDTPVSVVHLVLNVMAAMVAGAVVFGSAWSVPSIVLSQPLGGAPFVLLTGTSAFLVYLNFTLRARLAVAMRGAS